MTAKFWAALVSFMALLTGVPAHAETISTGAVRLVFEEQYAGASSFDQTAATGNPNQSRPLQLPLTGSGTTGVRNFVFNTLQTRDVAGPSFASPVWTPIGQYGPANDPSGVPQQSALLGAGQQRFDYSFDAADDLSAAPDVLRWADTFRLVGFGAFYLQGDCAFCGPDKPVQLVQSLSALNGSARYEKNGVIDAVPGNNGTPFFEAGNFYDSDVFDVTFGTSGITGTLQFSATTATVFSTAGGQRSSWGRIILGVNESPASTVPEPASALLLMVGFAGLWLTSSCRLQRINPRSRSKAA